MIFYSMNQRNKLRGNNSNQFWQQTNLTASSSSRGKTPDHHLRTLPLICGLARLVVF
ncbi:hypothetical protein XBFFL1_1670002 [Xenorhabdus bovienii str. feltiae Florida]|nr:hypothetical protein XBFFR1_280002 [Xenorhabdus bovienii str. feltiae France]CDG91596.1 hypothetical protein XBFFL1_1670002 [Xenorhabdus bovienii str. feltiae Florida]